MSDLIDRIDEQRGEYHLCGFQGTATDKLLADCKAEIKRLIVWPSELYDKMGQLRAEIERLRDDRDLEKKIRKDTEAQREELIERLSAVGEPVAWINEHYLKVLNDGRAAKREMMAQCANAQIKDTDVALYPAPPSIDALIAEIDSVERKCFCDGDKLSEILDKYRSAK